MYANILYISSFSIILMEEPCCLVFRKCGKNIFQDGVFFPVLLISTRKEKSYWKCVIPSCKGKAITSGDFNKKSPTTTEQILLLSGPDLLRQTWSKTAEEHFHWKGNQKLQKSPDLSFRNLSVMKFWIINPP